MTLLGAGLALGSPSEVELHPVPMEMRLVGRVWPRGGVGLCPGLGKGREMLWEEETRWENRLQGNEEIAAGKPSRKGGSVGLLSRDHLRKSMEGAEEVSPACPTWQGHRGTPRKGTEGQQEQ